MAPDAQLEWEARLAKPAAAAAFGGAALLIAGTVLQNAVAPLGNTSDRPKLLHDIHDHASGLLLSAGVVAVSYLLLGVVLFYLFGATRARREQLPALAIHLVWIAPLLVAASTVIGLLDRIDIAHQFVSSGAQTSHRAKDLLDNPSGLAVGFGLGGGLAFAISLVLINLNAMRAGLLNRFLGVVGIVIGALYVFPIAQVAPFIVQIFWLGSLGAVFLDRYPGGRGRAWATGQAEPWLSRSEVARRQAREEDEDGQSGEDAGSSNGTGGDAPRPASRKRKKRKKRR